MYIKLIIMCFINVISLYNMCIDGTKYISHYQLWYYQLKYIFKNPGNLIYDYWYLIKYSWYNAFIQITFQNYTNNNSRRDGDILERFILVFIVVVIIFSLLTYLLHRITIKKSYVKYLLPLFTLFLAIYNFYQSKLPSEGFKDLGSILMAFIFFAGFISSLISGLLFDFLLPKLKKIK